MSINLVPVVVAVLGLLLYFLSPNAKIARVGEILFFVGALASLMTGSHSCTLK